MQDRTGLAGHPEASVAAEQQLLTDAVNLMGLGLSTVFVFLTLLVGVTSLMSTLVNRLAPAKAIATTQAQAAPIEPTSDESLLAVIAAAIHAHRARR
jgi:oxaloacetate decarboxylase gamma subunit